MKPARIPFALCLAAAFAPALAAKPPVTPVTPAKPVADARIGAQLDALEYRYEIDGDGDYKLVFNVDEAGTRSQLVFVRSVVETYGNLQIREVWSPGYVATGDQFPVEVANRLLEASMQAKLGAWTRSGNHAFFVVRLPADADAETLDTVITAAITTADAMEAELTPGKDEL